MLENFLKALTISGAEKKLKRVLLVTGAKHYGVHLGPVKSPMEENEPWVEGEGRPPNFYYRQQRILKELSKGKGWDWVVTYPNDVIGVAKGEHYFPFLSSMHYISIILMLITMVRKFHEPSDSRRTLRGNHQGTQCAIHLPRLTHFLHHD